MYLYSLYETALLLPMVFFVPVFLTIRVWSQIDNHAV